MLKEKGRLWKTKLEDCVFSGQEELGEAYNPLRAGTDCE